MSGSGRYRDHRYNSSRHRSRSRSPKRDSYNGGFKYSGHGGYGGGHDGYSHRDKKR